MLSYNQREELLYAPYAMFSRDSAGREFDEPEHPYRGPYQRDRDRILHSSAFRRLSGKMQVFTGHMGDYHRTRLTHTFEVATIARTVARALRVNEDLVEALALMHDVGHPPFGHAGEDVLNEILADDGGFSHNQFALVLVKEIEIRYTERPGLNLSKEVLDGQVARIDKDSRKPRPLLEVQLVDAADSTTYDAHDADDALKLGLVTLEDMKQCQLINDIADAIEQEGHQLSSNQLRKAVVYRLINRQVTDLIEFSGQQLERMNFQTCNDVITSSFLIEPSPELAIQKSELELFLHQNVYRHPEIMVVRQQAQNRLRRLAEKLISNPQLIPSRFQARIDLVGKKRAVVEFIAGMTDHYCEKFYSLHFSS
ncbi:MAG TPA: dNTP triphosphohydrolase [Pirellulaceae bacterium]|nr:dNTP triphosphohydrolase [Pirellulaceae bacterium]HMO90688.1 dNTP triphosphohydrolase [Pirellulaceae bacterium]HMP67733.1 dNTP triphosphohydrolase [Pirellulaceae bacterium]